MSADQTDWLYNELSSLRSLMTEQHQRLRSDLMAEMAMMRVSFTAHEREDRLVADRVTRIEEQRNVEKEAALKRGTWAGIMASVGSFSLFEGLKLWLGSK